MYASLDYIREYCENPENTKPFILCEYSHAMGNGPGDLEDYWELIDKYDNFVGGFIWEWCDHAMYRGQTITGKAMYGYGGDFGEYPMTENSAWTAWYIPTAVCIRTSGIQECDTACPDSAEQGS